MIITFITNLLLSPNLYYNSHYEKFADGTIKCIDEEIPFDIPQNWCWERWGNLSQSIQYGFNTPALNSGVIRMVRISDIQNGNVVWETVPFCNIKEAEIDSYLLEKDDILFARTGGTVGKSFLVHDTPYPAIYAGYLIRTRYSKMLSARYMKNFMESELYWKQLKDGTIATAQPNCNGKTLGRMIVPIPPFEEQNRIVTQIDVLMKTINRFEQSKIELDKLEAELQPQLKKSILQYAIQGKLVAQNPTDEPASELLKQINAEKNQLIKDGKIKRDKNTSIIFKGDDNKYFEKKGNNIVCIDDEIPFDIPDSWEWVRFKNLVQFSLGKTPERVDSSYWSPNDFPWVSIADMKDKTTLTKTKEFISQKALTEKFNNTFSPIGTLIMSFKLTIGKVSILGINAVHNEAIISIFPFINEDNIIRDYLYNFLSIITGYTASTDAIKGTTLNSKKISEMLVPLPPLQEQKRIIEALDNVLASIMRN